MILKTTLPKRNDPLNARYGLEFYDGAVSGTGLIFNIEHSRLGRKPSKIVIED